ncbi:hypothetical protein COLO4_09390 [Corchorus olitorius]|uniref:Uncharacterized protein n=1 Tax=Corchorus olitorius TaxID=93759 RepID=A0A1R3KC79_9ROSI|nr:hypothetical protein COLO4_09390 [Corchorus olitorius]
MGKSYSQLATLEFSSFDHTLALRTHIAHVTVKSFPKLSTLIFEKIKVFKAAVRFIIANSPELKVIHFRSCYLIFDDGFMDHGRYTYTFDWRRSKGSKSGDSEWFFHYMTDDLYRDYDGVSRHYDRWIN